jgi:hypothetical protein
MTSSTETQNIFSFRPLHLIITLIYVLLTHLLDKVLVLKGTFLQLGILKPNMFKSQVIKNTTFLLLSSGKGGGPTQFDPLERASLSHWTILVKGLKHYKHLLSGFLSKR